LATRGFENVKPSDLKNLGRGRANVPATPSKYRNVKTVIDGLKFDSKREAAIYAELRMREKAGEIRNLLCQVRMPLFAPDLACVGEGPFDVATVPALVVVADYIADFTFLELHEGDWRKVIADAKGGRNTQMFTLKKKWLELQQGIEIREIR